MVSMVILLMISHNLQVQNFYNLTSDLSGTAKMYAYGTRYLKFRDPSAGNVEFSFNGEDGKIN